ncbi:MAG: hypothetical protein V4642_06340 [Bacteroidota bacterium]
MNYGILLLLWIVLPDFTSTALHTSLAENLQWQFALAIAASLYYCRIFHIGIFKKLYEDRAMLAISIAWIIAFTFLKGSEISFKESTGYYTSPMMRFNDIFDMIFVISYPAFTLVNAARIFIKASDSKPISLTPVAQKIHHKVNTVAGKYEEIF